MRQYSYDRAHEHLARVACSADLMAVASWRVSGCGKADSAPPVATVSLKLSKNPVAVGGVLDLTYRFQVAAGREDHRRLSRLRPLTREDGTHHLDRRPRTGRIGPRRHAGSRARSSNTRARGSFRASRILDRRRSRWAYIRTMSGCRCRARTPPTASRRRARTRWPTLELLPRSESLQVFYLSGWHPTEYSTEDPTVDWQWTQKVATLSVKNPKRDVTFFLDFDARPDAFGAKPQQVTIFCGERRRWRSLTGRDAERRSFTGFRSRRRSSGRAIWSNSASRSIRRSSRPNCPNATRHPGARHPRAPRACGAQVTPSTVTSAPRAVDKTFRWPVIRGGRLVKYLWQARPIRPASGSNGVPIRGGT